MSDDVMLTAEEVRLRTQKRRRLLVVVILLVLGFCPIASEPAPTLAPVRSAHP